QLEPGDPLGLLHHLRRDGGGLLRLGRQGAPEDGAAGAEAGQDFQEVASGRRGGRVVAGHGAVSWQGLARDRTAIVASEPSLGTRRLRNSRREGAGVGTGDWTGVAGTEAQTRPDGGGGGEMVK